MRSKHEIEDMIAKAGLYLENGATAVGGMTYEEGVDAALRWVLGETEDEPIEEEFDDDNVSEDELEL